MGSFTSGSPFLDLETRDDVGTRDLSLVASEALLVAFGLPDSREVRDSFRSLILCVGRQDPQTAYRQFAE